MDSDELRDRVEGVLREAEGDPTIDVTDLRRLSGGASRETWSVTSTTGEYVLQRARAGSPRAMTLEASVLGAAQDAGVPVPRLVASGDESAGLGAGFLLSEFVEGETIARKILRDDEFAGARPRLAGDCGTALARIHSIPADTVAGLEHQDQWTSFRKMLDDYGDPHPAFELAFAWLDDNRPASRPPTLVHGDFRLGNLMVGPDGLRAVIDWELAHVGDPMEDLGWLCARAWRFGSPLPVGGVGDYQQLFDAYGEASGAPVDPATVRWWETLGTLKWGIMCITQARSHLDGWSRSMELAAIGRRICENEYDLMNMLAPDSVRRARAVEPADVREPVGLHGRPTATELLEAVKEWIEGDVRNATSGRVQFHTRVAANVLDTLDREVRLGPAMASAHRERLASLGAESERELADRIRAGSYADRLDDVHDAVAATVVDKLRVANPRYF